MAYVRKLLLIVLIIGTALNLWRISELLVSGPATAGGIDWPRIAASTIERDAARFEVALGAVVAIAWILLPSRDKSLP
jgi:hypothetical protein